MRQPAASPKVTYVTIVKRSDMISNRDGVVNRIHCWDVQWREGGVDRAAPFVTRREARDYVDTVLWPRRSQDCRFEL